MLKSLLPSEKKVNITIVDIILRSKLTTNETLKFKEKSIFFRLLGLTHSHSDLPNDPPKGYIQKKPETIELKNPIRISESIKFIQKVIVILGVM